MRSGIALNPACFAAHGQTAKVETAGLFVLPFGAQDNLCRTFGRKIPLIFNQANLQLSTLLGLFTTSLKSGADTTGKIPIDPARWYQLNNAANGLDGLFDGNLSANVQTGYGKILKNFDAYYPLENGEQMTLESIKFYDGEGTNTDAPLTISIINEQWQRIPIATFTGSQYNTWVGPYPDRPNTFKLDTPISGARYLVLNTSGAYPNELVFYGSHRAGTEPMLAPLYPAPLSQTFGVNAFEWDFSDPNNHSQLDETRVKAAETFSSVRHYIDWEKLEFKEGAYTFNTTISGGWNYDAIYERCKKDGIEVLACIKTIPSWMQLTYPADQRDSENVPLTFGKPFSDPNSYIEQAKAAFQYAARYGHNQSLAPALVTVFSAVKPASYWSNSNVQKIGLGLINYMECDNERDKWWKGRKAYQTGREYAANLSAFYDGHKNTMGPGVGVKNADPTMKVVIGGLAAPTTDYVRGMIDWCKEFRGYNPDGTVNLCWDVMNQHLYANDAKLSQGGQPTRGAAPELSGVGLYAQAFVKLARQTSARMPVWITEAGYDVNPYSTMRAIAIGNRTVLETQADWTLRTALLYARLGIDRLFLYQLYDDDVNSTTKFQSMGLLNSDHTRKPAGDYIYQTKKLLGDYTYQETLSQDPLVDRYELNGQSAYMLVVPDEKGRTAEYVLNLGKSGTTQLYKPKISSDTMDVANVNPTAGKLRITVTETPLFVIQPGKNSVDTGLESIQVYPNPAMDYVNIILNNNSTADLDLKIYDASGRSQQQFMLQKASSSFSAKIDLAALPYGVYLLEIKQGTERVTRKILKTH